VNGSISTYYTKDPANPVWDNDAGMKLYRQLMAKYLPGVDATNGLYTYGMAKAYTFVQALRAAGSKPTRASLMNALAIEGPERSSGVSPRPTRNAACKAPPRRPGRDIERVGEDLVLLLIHSSVKRFMAI